MSGQFLHLTWQQFDQAVDNLTHRYWGIKCQGIWAPPRGGLVLAVALSHRLGLPLLTKPEDGHLWVDDIVDSGTTFEHTSNLAAYKAAWFLRHGVQPPPHFHHVTVVQPRVWVVFPWENHQNAYVDRLQYNAKRL